MGEAEKSKDADEFLKPFYDRATEAEDRLAKLESLLSRKDTDDKAASSITKDLEAKLQIAQTEITTEREKASKLEAENKKLQYRVDHLKRAVEEADSKLKNLKT